ncbi:MAG: prephenate dehydrogenase [Anaerolineaceae bacterium]|nr:prephenate dehydrogenase [Anaerolineaceae bacterium]
MIDFAGANVCIIGMGLMGSSAAQQLIGKCKKLIGVDRDGETIQYVLHKHWIDAGYQDFADIDDTPDIIIFTIPVQQILKYLDAEVLNIKTPCIIIDFGSTKNDIIKKMSVLPKNFQCFACHPMCGKEMSGPFVSDKTLYIGKPFLYHAMHSEKWAFDVLVQLVNNLGARMIELDPQKHDRQLAYISHVPYLSSAALALISSRDEQSDPQELWNIAANGFFDMTRLAGSDVSMIQDIVATNSKEISYVLDKLIEELSSLKSLIEKGKSAELRQNFETAKKLKERAYQCRELPSSQAKK